MSSLSRVLAVAVLGVALTLPLAACSGLRPVYGDTALGQRQIEVSYNEPTNRTEQIIYQELALRLGKGTGKGPTVSVSTSVRGADLTNDLTKLPVSQRQVTVQAKILVTSAKGKVIFSGVRAQTADYTTDKQSFANQEAAEDAAERAARLLADTIRLEVLAALAG